MASFARHGLRVYVAACLPTRRLTNCIARSRPLPLHQRAFRISCISRTTTEPLRAPIASTAPTTDAVPWRPVSFYVLKPLSAKRVYILQKMIQQRLEEFGVVGRIYLAPETGVGGINCQMAVPVPLLPQVKAFFDSLSFGPITYTEGLHDSTLPIFNKLRVLVKKNLVATYEQINAHEIRSAPNDVHLPPETWHCELNEKGSKALVVDMRNHYEYNVGRFENAVKMDVETFREGLPELERLVEEMGADKDIYMYCTGGIRCDVASSVLQKKGHTKVKLLRGGITAYGQYIRESKQTSLFKGKNFTFDNRRGERMTDDVLSRCLHCGTTFDTIVNCVNRLCNMMMVQCPACRVRMKETCSDLCRDHIEGKREYNLEYNYSRQIRPPSAPCTSSTDP